MLRIEPAVLNRIAADNGWTHARGRLAGTINATAMAKALGVSVSTITRAYDTGSLGVVLLGRLQQATGWSLDRIATISGSHPLASTSADQQPANEKRSTAPSGLAAAS